MRLRKGNKKIALVMTGNFMVLSYLFVVMQPFKLVHLNIIMLILITGSIDFCVYRWYKKKRLVSTAGQQFQELMDNSNKNQN